MNIGEVFIALGFDVDESKLKSFSDKINGLQKSMLVLGASAAGAIFGLESFMRGSIDSATALENLKDMTGENVTAVEKWMAAGNKANSLLNYDAIRESILGVNQALAAGTLGENSSIFGKLGISPFGADGKAKLGTEFLDEIRHKLPEIIKRYAPWQGLKGLMPDLSALGVNQGLLQALQLNDAQFAAAAKNYQVVEQTLQKNKKLGQDIADLTQKFQNFKDTLVGDWAEPVGKALDSVTPEIKKIYDGFEMINGVVLKMAAGVAAGLAIMFSPLFAAGAAAVTIIGLLDMLGEVKRVGWSNFGTEIKEGVENTFLDMRKWYGLQKQGAMPDGSTLEDHYLKSIYAKQGSRDSNGQWTPPVTQTNSTTVTNNFTVNGANDPQSVADHIGKELGKQYSNAYGALNGANH